MLDLGCGKVTRIVFCLAGSSTSMSWGQLTNGRGVSVAIKSIVKLSDTDRPISLYRNAIRNSDGEQFPYHRPLVFKKHYFTPESITSRVKAFITLLSIYAGRNNNNYAVRYTRKPRKKTIRSNDRYETDSPFYI